MKISQDIPTVRKEFFELNNFLLKNKIIKEDIISMGNLALFVDYSHNRYKWVEKKKSIKEWTLQKDMNEVLMFIANEIYEIAIRLEISDNLPFKLKKMTSSYKDNKLRYFDMVLDPYEFPDWFQRLMWYLPIKNKKELYKAILKRLETFPNFQKRGEQIAVAYFVDKIYENEKVLERVAELDELIDKKEENQLAWYLASIIFGYYYPEMEKLNKKDEQSYALEKLKEYRKQYEQHQLQTFDLFTDTIKEQFLKDFSRDT